MNFIHKNLTTFHLTGICIIAFSVTVSLWIYGMPDPEDALRHFQFASSVYDSLSEGDFYIQGEPNVNQGYGGIALRFYPPFTYYLLSAAYLVTGNWYDSAFLFFWMLMVLSGTGIYFLAREWISKNFAFLAAVLYTIDSFRNAQIQLTYAYAEFVAGGLLTFCFLFASRTARRGNLLDFAGLSASFGLLLLTHVPVTMIGSICLFLFCLFSLERESWRIQTAKLTAAAFVGILAASFHWIRIFTESQWINHASPKFLTEGFYNYQNHFLNIRATMFPGDLIFLCFLIFILPSISILFFKTNAKIRRKLYPVISVTLVSLFMATSYSQFIWENLFVLQKIQFPWRWLTITAIGATILIAAGTQCLKECLGERKFVLSLWIFVCVAANGYFTGAYIIGANLMDTGYFLVSKEKFNHEVSEKTTAKHHIFWQTIWVRESAFNLKNKVETDNREIEVIKWRGFDKEFIVSEGNMSEVRVAQFYYPYWKAKVNNIDVPVSKTEDGAILLSIPAETSTVRLTFVEPFIVKLFITVSIFSWLLIIALFLINWHKATNNSIVHNILRKICL